MNEEHERTRRRCRVCGCDDLDACDTLNGPCHWVEDDLCSACVERPKVKHVKDQGVLLSGELLPRPRPDMVWDEETLARLSAKIKVELNGMGAMCLIATIQLACRHPHFHGPTREYAETFARRLERELGRESAQLRALLQAGWNPAYDVVYQAPESQADEEEFDDVPELDTNLRGPVNPDEAA